MFISLLFSLPPSLSLSFFLSFFLSFSLSLNATALQMPRMDGYEATRQLRAMGFARPIVGCTGNAMNDQVRDFIEAGADHVMSKPVSQDVIALSLRRVRARTSAAIAMEK